MFEIAARCNVLAALSADNRIELRGRAGDVKRVFAVMGCDLVRSEIPGGFVFVATLDGEFVASIATTADGREALAITCN